MSIRIMSQVWSAGPEKQGHLLVMLALADYANDDGECWPSMASIARKARMTERGTQKIVRQLEADGWVKIETGNGRKGCNRYVVNPERRTVNEVHPERETPNVDVETPNVDAKTPNVGTPEPSRTIKEPSVKKERPPEKAKLPDGWVMPDEFLAYAEAQGLTANDISEEGFSFHAYFTDKNERRSERGWLASWQRWARKAAAERRRKPRSATSRGGGGFLDEIAAAARS